MNQFTEVSINWRKYAPLLEAKIEALGDEPTERQCQRLAEWVVMNFDRDNWGAASFLCLDHGLSDVYAIMSERRAECRC